MTVRLIIMLTLLMLVNPTAPGAEGEIGACCPQTGLGWMLFQDSNPRAPDFWCQTPVVVEAIEVCSHGIHFFFVAEEDDQTRYVALVVVKPTRELFETRVHRKLGSPSPETWLRKHEEGYAKLLAKLDFMFERDFSHGGRLDFTGGPSSERPTITPVPNLILSWRGVDYKMRGYLDVYMTLFT